MKKGTITLTLVERPVTDQTGSTRIITDGTVKTSMNLDVITGEAFGSESEYYTAETLFQFKPCKYGLLDVSGQKIDRGYNSQKAVIENFSFAVILDSGDGPSYQHYGDIPEKHKKYIDDIVKTR